MTAFNRRKFLAGSAAALLVGPAVAAPLPGPSDLFTDSVGVNVHIGSEPYASNFDRFHGLLATSGIRHLRDELRPSNDLARWRMLNERSNVLFNILVSPATNTVPEMMAYLDALGIERISAMEGQNEGDSPWFMSLPLAKPGWSNVVVAYQREVHQALRAHYTAEQLPLLSPSVLNWKPADVALLRPASPYSDAVAIHSYVQGGQEPETSDDYAAVAWYLQNMRDAFKPGAPAVVTECGYCTVVKPGSATVGEIAAGIYLPRLLLNNFRSGILRTFLYEFCDGGTDPNEGEHHWGLVRNDGTPKPGYHAVRHLLSALQGAHRAGDDQPLRVTTRSLEIRHIAFRDAQGQPVLAVWRAVRCWDVAKAEDIAVAAEPVDIAVEGRITSLSFNRPNDGSQWQRMPVTDGHATISLDGRVAIVRPAA
ncbi:hypothetical protein E0H22_05330 [Rhodopseudomonas boonkerdii]|uniref:hypothetical protein n=1 Tax=Rhodopseudomonas boonkerdii TaxID=475937 RepID=UPI001E482B41|nr:hypothetical protein [Rhodopseudomonas boonkerdii]UGV25150.1 hypothetical protein E0H22_05330 [Rhodopseudomonas boonkerdii]